MKWGGVRCPESYLLKTTNAYCRLISRWASEVKNFTGVEEVLRIEGSFQSLEELDLMGINIHR
jgi:hypothetical protein